SYLVDVLPGAIVFGIGLPAALVGVTVTAGTAVGEADRGIAAGAGKRTQYFVAHGPNFAGYQ
ncbi:hypothetical protein, partial [Nocardia abscessus]|uniref:hypothetical protein n=1 Tax=Nocardia abscessus TaxID=120957 RepID=UPI002456BB48